MHPAIRTAHQIARAIRNARTEAEYAAAIEASADHAIAIQQDADEAQGWAEEMGGRGAHTAARHAARRAQIAAAIHDEAAGLA